MQKDDVIYRQAAIDYFVTNVGFHDENGYPIDDSDELRKIWTEYFDGIPSAQPEPQWTSSGKKPPEEGIYLVWMPFAPPKHRITVAKYCGGFWNIKTPVSAWMPLPEPYREDGEKE